MVCDNITIANYSLLLKPVHENILYCLSVFIVCELTNFSLLTILIFFLIEVLRLHSLLPDVGQEYFDEFFPGVILVILKQVKEKKLSIGPFQKLERGLEKFLRFLSVSALYFLSVCSKMFRVSKALKKLDS